MAQNIYALNYKYVTGGVYICVAYVALIEPFASKLLAIYAPRLEFLSHSYPSQKVVK